MYYVRWFSAAIDIISRSVDYLLTEVFQGELSHDSGSKGRFSASLAFTVPDVEPRSAGSAVSSSISSGFVEWDYLGLPARITKGTIAFFTLRDPARQALSTVYHFEFLCEGTAYSFAGEKRFHPAGDASTDLSTIHASVRIGNRSLASGPLSSPLKEMLTGYEGTYERSQPSPSIDRFHEYRHLPPLLTAEPQMSDGLWRTLALLAEVVLPTPLPAAGPSIADVVDGIARFMNKDRGRR
jgi:hypothetical protein